MNDEQKQAIALCTIALCTIAFIAGWIATEFML